MNVPAIFKKKYCEAKKKLTLFLQIVGLVTFIELKGNDNNDNL